MGEQELFYEMLLNLPNLKIDSVEITSKLITIECQTNLGEGMCPVCGALTESVNQRSKHRLRDLGISNREVYLLVKVKQFECKCCGRYFTETLPFADLGKSYTHRQAEFMFLVGRKQSYAETAVIVNMTPKTVERVVLAQCEATLNLAARYAGVRRLGIDELSHRKGKKDYICVLTDLDRGTVLDLLPNRRKATLIAHFHQLGAAFCAQITDVSCDIWDAYMGVAAICFPQATLTLDRFHVTKLLNEGLDTYRKHLRKSALDNHSYKHIKHLLYKQYHTLSDTQLDLLDQAFACDSGLEDRYFLRESFHHILENATDVTTAKTEVMEWIATIRAAKIVEFDRFIKTLDNHLQSILNYVTDQISNAVTEGLNNLIRSVKRFSWGMPSFPHL